MKTVRLDCPSCGANLKIAPRTESFACAHCGVTQYVSREGGTVSLELLAETISSIRDDTSRITEELELSRRRDDFRDCDRRIESLDSQISQLQRDERKPTPPEVVVALMLVGLPTFGISRLAFGLDAFGGAFWGIIFSMVGLLLARPLYFLWKIQQAEVKKLAETKRRDRLQAEIESCRKRLG